METHTLAGWLIVVGLVLVAAQVVVSIITAIKTKKEKDQPSTKGLGDVLGEILKALATSIPLGVLGFVFVLVGLILGGNISIETLFPPAAS